MEKEPRKSQRVNKADLSTEELAGLDLSGSRIHIIRCIDCDKLFVSKSPVALRCDPHKKEKEREMWRIKRKKAIKGTNFNKEVSDSEYNRSIAKHIKFR